jgi:RNA polymerase sigma factor (sigma-70 family)
VPSEFATTQWSQVLAARDAAGTEARRALEALCNAYWYPLYAYLRRKGEDPEEARDLTQAFFAELLDKRALRDVDPAKGRFRSFLLAALRHFLSHERDRARSQKRGGGVRVVSLDTREAENRFSQEPVEHLDPEQLFERRWGLTVMERAMDRLQAERVAEGDASPFQRLRGFLTGSEPRIPYREAAAELGMTEGAVKSAVHRLRRRYGSLLREEIAHTVRDPSEVDDEVRHLLAVVQPWQAPPP